MKHSHKIKKGVALLAAMAAIVMLAAVVTDLAYAEQLPPGVSINGQTFAGQNATAVSTALQKQFKVIDDAGVTLHSGTTRLLVHYSQVGITPNYGQMVSEAFAKGHSAIAGFGTVKAAEALLSRTNNISLAISADQNAFQAFSDKTLLPAFGAMPQDASLNIGDAGVTVTPEKDGVGIDNAMLESRMVAALSSQTTAVDVPLVKQYADIRAAELAVAKTDAEQIIKQPITLQAQSAKITPSQSDIIKWILIHPESDGLHARLDPDKVKAYLSANVAPKVSTKAITQIVSKDGTVTQAGADGTALRLDDSVTAIMNWFAKPDASCQIQLALDVKGKSTVVNDPQLGCDPNKSAGKYVEVNLTMQKMCLYDGANYINTFRVSTGKWSTPTPIGTFAIQNKIDVAYSSSAHLYMPHWSAITPDGAYGIHGLPYIGNWIEGVGHIGTPVSHGCIRLGPGDDIFVHNWVDIGTPVFIHK